MRPSTPRVIAVDEDRRRERLALRREPQVSTTSRRYAESDGALSGADRVRFAWVPLLAFVRLATKVGVVPRPASAGGGHRRSRIG